MRRWASIFAAWAVAIAAGPAAASPLWSSDDIRARRATGEAEALVFDLAVETRRDGKVAREAQVVTLAPDFTLVTEAGVARSLDDHALCLSLAWTPDKPVLQSANCHASVAFRAYEVRNRAFLGEALSRMKADKAGGRLYGAEAELGISDPGVTKLARRKAGDKTEFRLGAAVVATVSGRAGELSPDEARRFARFLARNAAVHPLVRGDIRASGAAPGLIDSDFAWAPEAGEARQVLRISNLRRAGVAYPLPPGLASGLAEAARQGGAPRDRATRAAIEAIAGRSSKPGLEATLARAEAATAAGRGLEALMLFLEVTQLHSSVVKPQPGGAITPALSRLRPVIQAAVQSRDAAPYWDANRLAGSAEEKGDREAAARFLTSERLDALPFGTFRYVTYANLIASSDRKGWDPAIAKAMPGDLTDNYWIHLAAQPWGANAWKDVGDRYMAGFDMVTAWQAFDIGRAVDAEWRVGVMATLAGLETELRRMHPDFF